MNRKNGFVKICNNGFAGCFGNGEPHDAEMQIEELRGVSLSGLSREIIKAALRGDALVVIFVCKQTFYFVCLLIGNSQVKRHIKRLGTRQVQAGSNTSAAIFDTKEERPALFLNMREVVVGFIASVRQQQDVFRLRTIHHGSQSRGFIGLSALLDDCIDIDMLEQIVHSVYMQQIVRLLPVCARIERVCILRIGGDLQVGTIDSVAGRFAIIELLFACATSFVAFFAQVRCDADVLREIMKECRNW